MKNDFPRKGHGIQVPASSLMRSQTVTELTSLGSSRLASDIENSSETVCWGCDRDCPADSMACGNGSVRAQHPVELFGEDRYEWEPSALAEPSPASCDQTPPA